MKKSTQIFRIFFVGIIGIIIIALMLCTGFMSFANPLFFLCGIPLIILFPFYYVYKKKINKYVEDTFKEYDELNNNDEFSN